MVDPPRKRKYVPQDLLDYLLRVPALFRGWPPDPGLQLPSALKLPGGTITESSPSVHDEIDHTIPEPPHFFGRKLETGGRRRVMGVHQECSPLVIR
jgi:hypothetical protein